MEELEDRAVPALVAAYGFEEGTGGTTADNSGSGRTGTLNGANWTPDGRHGKALSFNGTSNWVTVADAAPLRLTTGMTLEAWVYPTAAAPDWSTVVLKERGTAGMSYALYAADGAARPPAGYIYRSGTDYNATGTSNLPLNTWTHLAATYNGSIIRLYVDGTQVATRSVSGSMGTSTSPLRIGGNNVWGEYFTGRIDEVRIYNNALTQAQIQTDMATPVVGGPDTTPPTAAMTAPANNAVVRGSATVSATASDNVAVVGVQFKLDGVNLGAEDTTAPYSVAWDTATAANGGHTLTAVARDAAGNSVTTTAVNVTVDNAAPTAAVTAPASAATIVGTTTVSATASDNVAVVGVQFKLDGVNLGAEDTTAPYSVTWNSTTAANGTHQLTAVARDTAGNGFTSDVVSVTVDNGDVVPPTVGLTAPANNAHLRGSVDVSADATDNVGVVGVQFLLDGNPLGDEDTTAPYTVPWDTTTATTGSHTLTAVARDAAGNTAESVRTVTADNTPPVVAVTAPAAGASVSGTVTVTAGATDSIGVVGVQFFLDGVALGAEDTTAPYSIAWDTQAGSNGPHTLSAVARDAAGNTAPAADVSVAVSPDFSFKFVNPVKTVGPTGSIFYELDVAYLNGFTTPNVPLWFEGLPANVTADFALNPMSHQGRTELFVDTLNATPGTYTFTAGATANGITHTEALTLIVSQAADFALTTSPSIQNVTAGNAITFQVALSETNDFTDPVTLSVPGMPTGMTASFAPATVVPAGNTTLTLATTTATPAGTYTLNVTGIAGALTRTTPITVTVSSAAAVWSVSTVGSTGVPNNNVRLGDLRGDGKQRVYVGTIQTGRMLEYTWNGSGWEGPLDVGGSPTGAEIHNVTIGPGRGDGQNRLYAASYDNKLYEIWYDGTSWQQMVVGTMNNLGMHAYVGDGRNDGVARVYGASTQTLYEYTWNGTGWSAVTIGNMPGVHELTVGKIRNDGLNRVYGASISTGTYEANFTNGSWTISQMGDTGDARGLEIGVGRNDGTSRLYVALLDGRVREFTWNGTGWTIAHMPGVSGAQMIHAYILPGRNDGVNRIYTSSGNGKAYEYTWTGSGWTVGNLGGGSDYMYGLHYGTGRNDGRIRLYGADRGSVNRVYEYTWTAPDTTPPTAGMTAPSAGETVLGGVTVSADATDNIAMAGVQFLLDGVNLGAEDTTAPYSITWDSTTATNGTHVLTARARDTSGNMVVSAGRTVTVNNPVDSEPPTPPGGLSATGRVGAADLSWTASTDNIGVVRYNVHRSTTAGFTPTAGNRIAQPAGTTYADTGLSAGTYHYVVTAEDAAGNVSAVSNEATAAVTADAEAPTVAVTAPAPGATVSGSIALTATATDNVGVVGVQFFVDGTAIGAEDTTAPYTLVWDSRTVANGPHTVTARARDAAGNSTVSGAVSFTVTNNTGLIGAWGFEEGTGTTTADQSGNSLNGALSNATWTTAGRYGNALSFNGTNAWVTVADNNLLDLTTGMTLEAWVRPATTGPDFTTVVLKERGTTSLAYALYGVDGANRPPSGYINRNGNDVPVVGTSLLPLNTWSHLAVTYDGANMRLFVDGTQVAIRAQTGATSTSANPLRFGGNVVWGEYFNGLIDEIRIYNRALTAAELQSDMTIPVGGGGGAQLADRPAAVAGGEPTVSEAELAPLLSAAIDRWTAAGLPATAFPEVNRIPVRVVDLPGASLGFTDMRTGEVWIDRDAAGHGWFIDPTPARDNEFDAPPDGPAFGKYDLFTVVTHELGHLVGLADSPPGDSAEQSEDLMAQTLPPATRRVPSAENVKATLSVAGITVNQPESVAAAVTGPVQALATIKLDPMGLDRGPGLGLRARIEQRPERADSWTTVLDRPPGRTPNEEELIPTSGVVEILPSWQWPESVLEDPAGEPAVE
jgi:hypothetical protein